MRPAIPRKPPFRPGYVFGRGSGAGNKKRARLLMEAGAPIRAYAKQFARRYQNQPSSRPLRRRLMMGDSPSVTDWPSA